MSKFTGKGAFASSGKGILFRIMGEVRGNNAGYEVVRGSWLEHNAHELWGLFCGADFAADIGADNGIGLDREVN